MIPDVIPQSGALKLVGASNHVPSWDMGSDYGTSSSDGFATQAAGLQRQCTQSRQVRDLRRHPWTARNGGINRWGLGLRRNHGFLLSKPVTEANVGRMRYNRCIAPLG